MIGIEKLNLTTGNRVWSNYYTNGGNNTEVVNRVYAIEDTVYVFMTHYEPISLFKDKISPSGAGWNGRINAGLADNGTYVWTCRYTLEGQPEQFEKGIVQLIR